MKRFITMFIVVFMNITASAQIKVGDATLPSNITHNGVNLKINGAGLREKFFFDIYAGGLYLKSKNKNAKSIAESNETMVIKIHVLSSMMNRKKMAAAFREGFKKSTDNKLSPYQKRIDKFIGFIDEEIEVDQIFDIVYIEGKGSVLYKNGKEKGYIEGLDFKVALFNIWLGNRPVDRGLKDEMLGVL